MSYVLSLWLSIVFSIGLIKTMSVWFDLDLKSAALIYVLAWCICHDRRAISDLISSFIKLIKIIKMERKKRV
jgi:hypothetical protein